VDLATQSNFGGHQRGALSEDGGRELVARLIDQRAGEVLAFADDDGFGKSRFERG
jgi:hypothetical protein